jgi:hypothetical protein
MPLPYEPIELDSVINVTNPLSDNSDLPADIMPILERIAVINLIGPLHENKQSKSLEKRTRSLLSSIQRLAAVLADIDRKYLRRDGTTQKTSGAGVTANIPMNGYKITGLPVGSDPQDIGVYQTWAAKVDAVNASFLGTPTAPTAAYGNNTNQLATTAFVWAAFNGAL